MISNSDMTIQTYRENFEKYVARTGTEPRGDFKEFLDSFASYLPELGSIFEIGSASGRDARYLASSNFNVTCTDVIPQALQQLSEQGFTTAKYDFRDDPKPEWIGSFDGVFAFSLKAGEGEEITTEKMDAPRSFNYHFESEIRGILTSLSFEILSITHAEDGK